MIRRILLCQRMLKHAISIEALQLKHLRPAFHITRQERCCHQPPNSTEPPKVLQPVPSIKTDLFLEEIKGLNTLQEMMACIEQNKEQVQSCHLEQVFTKLYHLKKENPSMVDELQAERSFTELCQLTLKHIRSFSRVEIVNLIRALSILKIPLDCTLGQASLQMLRHYINSLSLSHITLIENILKDQPPNPLIDALKKALPLSLEIQLSYQLDPNNLWLVLNCLNMAIRYNLDSSIIQNLSTIVHHKAHTLSQAKAISAVMSLSFLRPLPENLITPVNYLLTRLSYLLMQLSETEIKSLLLALHAKNFHHSKLFCSLSHRCCTEGWDLQNTTQLLSVYNNHKFLSTSVLNWVVESLNSNPTSLVEDERVSLLTICEALSEANHSIDRKNFICLIEKCGNKLNRLEEESPERLVKLAMHLAILECIPLELMERVFQPEFISKVMKSVAEKDRVPSLLQCYLTLEQSARLDHQATYNGPFLPPDLLKEAIRVRAQVMKPLDLVLQQFLEVGLGGSQFMLTGLWTRLGHFIDHLIVMRKEDFPIELNSEKSLTAVKNSEGFTFVEDVVLPENSKVLAVLVARQEWFNKDPPRLRGWMSFQQKILAKMGYNPVIIGPPIEKPDQIQDIDCRLESESF